jgi:hypothetical protein
VSQRPSLEEQWRFLLRAYFGADGDQTRWFISRAYRDMNRTLHGLSKQENAKELVEKATKELHKSLCELQGQSVPTIPDELATAFNQWHLGACDRLMACFQPFHCHYGQAQKWINMTIKYSWFFSGGSELDAWYSAAHVPVDEFILRAAAKHGIERPPEPWSRWDDQTKYEAFQTLIRDCARQQGATPLELEHEWWMQEGVKPWHPVF